MNRNVPAFVETSKSTVKMIAKLLGVFAERGMHLCVLLSLAIALAVPVPPEG